MYKCGESHGDCGVELGVFLSCDDVFGDGLLWGLQVEVDSEAEIIGGDVCIVEVEFRYRGVVTVGEAVEVLVPKHDELDASVDIGD